MRPMSFEILAGLASEWAGLLPGAMIVDGPAELLRMARSQFAHSWFDYEFMVTACLIGFQALEAAFRVLYPEAERTPFRGLIRKAQQEGILPDSIAELADAGAELRNSFSHPLTQTAPISIMMRQRTALSSADPVDSSETAGVPSRSREGSKRSFGRVSGQPSPITNPPRTRRLWCVAPMPPFTLRDEMPAPWTGATASVGPDLGCSCRRLPGDEASCSRPSSFRAPLLINCASSTADGRRRGGVRRAG
jgi:hypothetical protein